jgi:tetratricopeptide (TPR) repeat protein
MRARRTGSALAVAAALALVIGACRPDDQRTETVDPEAVRAELAPEVAAQLDSGTVTFRARDLEAALRHYRRATELAPDLAGGWFGLYMTERALGNTDAAAEALARARGAAPGASLLFDEEGDTLR